MNNNYQSKGIIILVAIFLIVTLAIFFEGAETSTNEISYTQFLNKVQLNEIESVTITKDTLIAVPKESAVSGENSVDIENNKKITNPLNINKIQQKLPQNKILSNENLKQNNLSPIKTQTVKVPKIQYKVQLPQNYSDVISLLKEKSVEINKKM